MGKNYIIRNFLMITLIVLLLFVVMLRIFMFQEKINTQLESSAMSTFTEVSSNLEFYLSNDIEEKYSLLQNVIQSLLEIGDNQAEIQDYIEIIDNHNSIGIENLIIVADDGDGITAQNIDIDISHYPYFDDLKNHDYVVSNVTESVIDGESCVSMAIPIFENEIFVGAIQVEIDPEHLKSLLYSSFEGKGYYYILDSNGTIITQAGNGYALQSNNLFENLSVAELDNEFSLTKYIDIVQKEGMVSFDYSIDGQARRAQVRTIGDTSWYIFMAVPDYVIFENANAIKADLSLLEFEIAVVISAVFLIFLCAQLVWSRSIQKTADYDELTGIYNLNKLKREIKKVLLRNPNERYTIVKIDMMNFKSINELHGFEVGNEVIIAFADVGKHAKARGFMQARVAADEFILFAPYEWFEDLELKTVHYEKVFADLVSSIKQHDFKFRYGRCSIPAGETNVDEIVNKVTMAHYFAKEKSVASIVDYNENFTKNIIRATEITNKISKAIANNEFKLYLQPKVNIDTKEIESAEALVRWQQEDGTFIYPNDFIPIIESNRFIVDLDFYMLDKTCRFLRDRIDAGKKYVPISVNFSRLHLSNEDTIEKLSSIVDSYSIPRNLIEIELTESASIDGEDAVMDFEKQLHKNKFKISMDDFGAGYSSFDTLQKINFDVIKLDRSFMMFMEDNDKKKLIIETIVKMAKSLGMRSVSEGVETKEQLEFLKEIGCDMAQGYYFSRPVEQDEFIKLL